MKFHYRIFCISIYSHSLKLLHITYFSTCVQCRLGKFYPIALNNILNIISFHHIFHHTNKFSVWVENFIYYYILTAKLYDCPCINFRSLNIYYVLYIMYYISCKNQHRFRRVSVLTLIYNRHGLRILPSTKNIVD